MKTPADYTQNLKQHIITKQMLLDCLYSSNKRAKNWRDKEREYRGYRYDKYHNEEKAREKKEEYYGQKETLLTAISPVCIHREKVVPTERIRIYEEDEDYWKLKEQGQFIHENSYFDREVGDYVSFGDILVEGDPIYLYFLFYDIGGDHTFHTPIAEESVSKYDLEVIDIGKLTTFGDKIDNLVSNQFVKKVVDLIESKDYQYIA